MSHESMTSPIQCHFGSEINPIWQRDRECFRQVSLMVMFALKFQNDFTQHILYMYDRYSLFGRWVCTFYTIPWARRTTDRASKESECRASHVLWMIFAFLLIRSCLLCLCYSFLLLLFCFICIARVGTHCKIVIRFVFYLFSKVHLQWMSNDYRSICNENCVMTSLFCMIISCRLRLLHCLFLSCSLSHSRSSSYLLILFGATIQLRARARPSFNFHNKTRNISLNLIWFRFIFGQNNRSGMASALNDLSLGNVVATITLTIWCSWDCFQWWLWLLFLFFSVKRWTRLVALLWPYFVQSFHHFRSAIVESNMNYAVYITFNKNAATIPFDRVMSKWSKSNLAFACTRPSIT